MIKRITVFLTYLFFFLQTSSCYPILKGREPRNEVRCSNGTIIGTYSYKDKSGNPISVKYYADTSGYGVELNSFKTLKLEPQTPKSETDNSKPIINLNLKPMKPLLELASEIMSFDNKLSKVSTEANAKKDAGIINHLEDVSKFAKITTPDYETFYQNEVKAPKQCEKDKVRVYLAKEKRKTRNAIETPHCA